MLEALEPRLLLSADISYPDLANITDIAVTGLTLKAKDLDGDLFLKLYQTSDLSNEVASVQLDDAGDVDVNITRGLTPDLFGDTMCIDLSTFSVLDTFVTGNGGKLNINFAGGNEIPLVSDDHLILQGNGVLGYGLSVNSSCDITLEAGASLAADDITISVAASSTGLPPSGLGLDEFYADSSATIGILGSLVSNGSHDIKLSASSDIHVDNSSLGLGSLQLAFIYANSLADINIGSGSQITAGGNLELDATSRASGIASMASLTSGSDADTDAAIASVLITSDAKTRISGNAQVNVGGALTMSAMNSTVAAAIADGSAGGAGATLGVAVIGVSHANTTEASIADSATVTAASINLNAESQNTLLALAKSTPGGAHDSDGDATSTRSQDALADNDASTSSGDVTLAGAVAVGNVNSTTRAYISSSGAITSSGVMDVVSSSVTSAQTRADGSSTVSSGDNVGIAVAIGVDVLHNDAYVGGTDDVTADALNVKALMSERELQFDSGSAVDDGADTIVLAAGAHGLQSGDAVVYNKGDAGNTAIGGLTDGSTYFVSLQSDGKVKLSDTRAHAIAGTNIINLTSGSGNGHQLIDQTRISRSNITAVAGASGGDTGVAGALAIGVNLSYASATISDNASVIITGGGNVNLTAENFVESNVKATAKQEGGGDVGVGASFALNIGTTDTDALIGDGADVTGAGDIALSASSKNKMDTTAEGGAAGETAVTPVIAISVSSNDTNAKLGTLGSATTLAGDLSLTASHEGSVSSTAEGDTESGDTGVGISLGLTVSTDSVVANTARDLAAGGAIAFSARTVSSNKSRAKASVAGGDESDAPAEGSPEADQGGVDNQVTGQRNFASDRADAEGADSGSTGTTDSASASGAGSGESSKVQVAGAVGITVVNSTSSASILDGLTIIAGGTLTAKSENNTDSEAVADASTVMARTVAFNPTASSIVNTGDETIDLGADHGFSSGDKVIYRKDAGGTVIGGLTDGHAYYVNVDGNKVKLYDTKEHAESGGSDGLVDISSNGTGIVHGFEAGGGPTGTGVGIAVAVNVAQVTNDALIGDSSNITADGLIVQALVPDVSGDQVHSFKAEATSGSSGADTGVAGALAINIGLSKAQSSVADNATVNITGGGEVALTAENFVANNAKATGKQEGGGSIGVGASIALNIGETDTDALVGDGASVIGASDITLMASSKNKMDSSGIGGSAGETAVTPVIVISVSNNDTNAKLGTSGGATALTGDLSLTASHEGSATTNAEGDTESGDTGVGISLALTISTDSAVATTARDITAGGDVAFHAHTLSVNTSNARASVAGGEQDDGSDTQETDQQVGGQRDFANDRADSAGADSGSTGSTDEASTDTSSGSVSVAGAISVTVVNSTSQAAVPEFRSVTAGSGGTGALILRAENLTEAEAVADGSAVTSSGGTGVGVGVSVNVANVTNEAFIGAGAVVSADGVTVESVMAHRDVSFTAASIPVVSIADDTIFVGMDSGLKTGDKLTYKKGAGGNAVIGGLDDDTEYAVRVEDGGKIKLYDTDTHAKAGGSTGLKNLTNSGTGTGHMLKRGLLDFGEDVTFDPASNQRLIDLGDGSNLKTGYAVTYDNGGGATMGGLNNGQTYYVITVEGNKAELAATLDDAVAGKAITLTSDGNTSQKFIDGTGSFRAEATSGAGGGDIGVAGSVAINIANTHTRAIIGYDADPIDGSPNLTATQLALTGGNVDIKAGNLSESFVVAAPSGTSGGAGGSDVGVGASFGLNISLNDTIAEIEDGEQVSGSTGHFIVSADSANATVTNTENGASGGGTSIGASIAIAVVENKTRAHIGSGTGGTISLAGDLSALATHANSVITTASGEAAGDDVAVGASVALNIVIDNTRAEIGRNFTGAQNVSVNSTSAVVSRAEAKASAKGAPSDSNGDEAGGTESRDSEQETNAQSSHATNRAGTSNAPPSDAQSGSVNTANENSSSQSSNEASEGGGTSVAASVAVSYMDTDNAAIIADGVTINATGNLEVKASSSVDAIVQGLSTSTNTDADTGVAAAVGVNIALVSNTAHVGDGAQITAQGIAVEAVMISGETNTFQSRALAGAASSDTAVGGSISINYIDEDTSATVGSNAMLHATGGDIVVAAESLNEIQNVAGGGALSTEGGTGIGVAIGVNIVNGLDTNAGIGHDTSATATGSVNVTATASLVPKTETLPVIGEVAVTSFSAGVAGSAGGTAVGGSSSVNVILMDTHAYIDDNATVTAGQNVTVSATDTLHVFSAAGGLAASSGGTGVGIGLDVGVIDRSTTAWIGSGADVTATSGDINVNADSDDDITSIAGSFGLSGGDVGVAGSVSVQVLMTETRAYTEDTPSGPGGTLTAGGDISVTANGDFKALMIAGAVGASSSAGVGVSNTTLVHDDTVEARIGNRNIVDSAGIDGVAVSATSTEEIIAITAAGGAASSVGIAVAPTINVLNEHTHASIGRSATVNAQNGVAAGVPGVSVTASDDTTIISIAGSIAAAGSVGVGVGADVLSLIKDTSAYIDSGVTSYADGDIDVSATSDEDITSVAAGIAVGGSAGVGVNASVHVLDITTRAFIGDDVGGPASAGAGDVHALGTVRISADDRTEMDKFVATVAVGGSAGVGAAATVSVITKHVEAFIGNGASVTGDGQTTGLDAANGTFGIVFAPAAAGSTGLEATTAKGQSVSSLQNAGEVGAPDVNSVDTNDDGSADADPAASGQRVLTPGQTTVRGVAVAATNRDDIETYSAAIGGGTVGVAVAAAVNVINVDTKAYIGDNASINSDQTGANASQTVSVAAGNDFHHVALAAGAGFGAVGVAPGVDVTVLSNDTTASIGAGAIVNARDDVRVDAHASEDILMVGMGIAAGTVGVGGGVSVLSVSNHTYGSIGGTVSAGGDAVVRSSDDTGVTVVSGALGAGFVGVGASVGVMVINKDTQAFVADGAVIDAKGAGTGTSGVFAGTLTGGDAANGFNTATRNGLVVQADSSEKILHIGVAAGAGFVGVSGTVTVSVIDSDTQAWIGNADINQTGSNAGANINQGVYVGAANEARITTFAGAIAGGFVGVGGAVDVGVLKNDVNAQIRLGAAVTAQNDVEVNALAIKEIDGYVLSGAGGFVGVAGAVSVWSVGTTLGNTYSDSNSDGSVNQTSNALEREKEGGGTDTADHDAAQQGENASGMVSGQLSGSFGPADDGNPDHSSDERLAGITDSGATSLNSSRPSAADVTASLAAAVPATTGTAASIANGAQVSAGDAITVNAVEDLEVDLFAGGAAGGFVGAGAGISVVSIASNVSASAGGNLTSGGALTVKAALDEDINVLDVAGGLGFVGLGAAVVVVNDTSTSSASIANGAQIHDAASITVSATSNRTLSIETGQITAGAFVTGASFTRLAVNGHTSALIDNNAQIGQGAGDTVGNINVTANETIDAHGKTVAIGAGAVAVSANFAYVDVGSDVSADIGTSADITSTGTVNVKADGEYSVNAEVFTATGGLGATGASIAHANLTSDVVAGIGAFTSVTAGGSINVETRLNHNGSNPTGRKVKARADAPSVGLALSGSGTDASAIDSANATASVGSGAQLSAGGSIGVRSYASHDAQADALALSLGLGAAFGASVATATADGDTSAAMNGSVTNASSLTVLAQAVDTGHATADAATAGLGGGGSGGVAITNVTPTIQATMGSGTVNVSGAVNLSAIAETDATATANGFTVGLGFGIGVMIANANANPTLDTHISGGSVTAGGGITLLSSNNQDILNKGAHAIAKASGGGIVSGQGAVPTAHGNASLNTYVGSAANLNGGSGGVSLTSRSMNKVDATADALSIGVLSVGASLPTAEANGNIRAHMDGTVSGGAGLTVSSTATNTATASAEASGGGLISETLPLAQATASPTVQAYIGNNAQVTVSGAATLSATSTSNATATADGLNIGIGAVGVMRSSATVSPTLNVYIGSGADVNAGSIALSATHNSSGANAISNASGGGIFSGQGAVPTATADASLNTYVASGATLHASGAISLTSQATNTANATAHALSIGLLSVGASLPTAEANGSVRAHMDGTITGGTNLTVSGTSTNNATASAEASGGGLISATLPLAQATASPLVQAYVGNNADVTVSGAANLSATSNSSATATADGLSIGLGAVGVMRSSATVSPTLNAYIGSGADVNAGSISLSATHNSSGANASSDAAGGGIFSGQGAVPTATANASLNTYVASGATLHTSGAISLNSQATNNAHADAHALSIGAGAMGASLPTATANGSVSTHMDGSITGGTNLTVHSTATNTASAQGAAVAGGLVGGVGVIATATASPTVNAYIGGSAIITMTGAATITAQSAADANAYAPGQAIGLVGLGATTANATVAPNIDSYIAGGATVTTGSITIDAFHNTNTATGNPNVNQGAHANATASGGGLVSANSATANSTANGDTQSYIGSGADITTSGTTTVRARAHNDAEATANGDAIGLFGGGTTHSTANGNGITKAYISGVSSLTAGSVTVLATGSTDVDAYSNAGSLGFIAARESYATSHSTPVVEAYVSSAVGTAGITVSGAVNITGLAFGSSSATASGSGVGVGSFGISQSLADWNPNVDAYIGAGTNLHANGDVNVMGLNNYNVSGTSPTADKVYANATSSGAGLVSAGGARSDANVNASVNANIGANAIVSGNNIIVTAKSRNFANPEVNGKSFGAGGFGAVYAYSTMTNEARATTGNGSHLDAVNDVRLYSESSNQGVATATGGVGGLLAVGGANASLNLSSNKTISEIGANSVVNAGNDVNIRGYNSGDLRSAAFSEATSAIADNRSYAHTQDLDSDTEVRIGAGAHVNAHTVTMRAEDGTVYVSANSVSKTNFEVVGDAKATGEVDADVRSLAFIGSNALVSATGLTSITAYQTAVKTYTRAETYVLGVQGALESNSDNRRYACAEVVAESGALVTTEQLSVLAYSERDLPDLYVRDAITTANTITELVSEIVGYTCEVIVSILCLGLCDSHEICSPVYKLVEHILASPVDQNYLGSNTTCNEIDWNANVTITGGSTPTLIVDANGNVTTAVGVTYHNNANEIIVDDIINDSNGNVQMTANRGEITGNSVFNMNIAFEAVNIINASAKDLKINDIEVLNKNTTTPPIHITATENTFHYTIVTNSLATDITIQNSNASTNADIYLLGHIENTAGETHILNAWGDIISGGPDAYIQTRILQLRADQGSVGSANNRIIGQLFYNTMSGEAIVTEAAGRDGVYLDLTGVTREGDASARVASATSALGNVDIRFEDGFSYDEETVLAVTLTNGTTLYGLIENEVLGTGFDLVNGGDTVHINSADVASTQLVTGFLFTPVDATYHLGNISAGGNVTIHSDAAELQVDGIMNAGVVDSIVTDSGDIIGGNTTHAVGGTNVNLSAGAGSIGSSGTPLRTNIGSGHIDATAAGNIFLRETSGDLRAGTITSISADVSLATGAGSIVDADNDAAADVSGRNITLTSSSGIGSASNYLEVNSSLSAAGEVTASASGNVFVTEAIGDLILDSAITSLGTVTLTSAGSILDDNDGGALDIIAQAVVLIAANSAGTSSNAIETQVSHIEGVTSNGGIWVDNTGALAVGGVSVVEGLTANGGPIVVTTHSPLTVTEDVTASGDIILTAADHAAAGEDFYQTSASVIQSTGSSVYIRGGDNVSTDAGTGIHAAGGIYIEGDYGNADAGTGSIIDLRGQMFGAPIEVHGNADADSITLSNTVQGHILLDGRGAGDTYVVNISGTGDYVVDVLDSGAGAGDTLTVNGTGSADDFLLRASSNDYPAGIAFVAALHGDPVSQVERINYNKSVEHLTVDAKGGDDNVTLDDNWTLTTILGGAGNDRFQVGQIFKSERDATAGLAASDVFETTATTRGYLSNGVSFDTRIEGEEGNDQFFVFRNKAELDLQGGADDDTFTIRAFALEGSTTSSVDAGAGADTVEYVINAPLNINGGDGNDTLRVIGTEFADKFVINATGIFGAGLTVSYTGVENVEVDGAEGNDEFYVLSTRAGVETRLFGGLGSDRFVIAGDAPEVVSNSGTRPAEAGSHTTDVIAGHLVIDGGFSAGSIAGLGTPVMLPGETNVRASDGPVLAFVDNPVGPDQMTVATSVLNTVLTDLSLGSLADLVGKTLDVSRGPGSGRFWLITNLIDNGDGTVNLTLRDPTQPDPTWGTPDTGSEFAISNLSANFFVNEAGQVDSVNVYNDASALNDTGTLTSDTLSGLNMGSTVSYGNIESLEISLGSGNDSFAVNSTLNRVDFRTITMLNTGAGDDAVTVTLDAAGDGPLAVNLEAGNDTLDGSASTLGLVVFGGDGQDTIQGGSGADMIFGDRGVVDFYNDEGTLVTRLGIGLGERSSTPSDPHFVPAVQTDGGFNERIIAATRDAKMGDADIIDGGAGNDVIFGGAGGDLITANLGGKIILGDHGEADLFGASNDVFSTDFALGGNDHIIGGSDGLGNIMIGGAGDDLLSGGTGNDVILGDNGYVQRDAANTVTRVYTIAPDIGGVDTIDGGAGNDVIMGGAAGDFINAPLGGKIILGDNGVANLAGDNRDVYSTDPAIGGVDIITGGADGLGNIIIGGAEGDQISGGSGDDVILGDSGYVQRAEDGTLIRVFTIAPDIGGVDIIDGGAGFDVILGGADGDLITATSGGKIILGDNGQVNMVGSNTDVFTTDPTIGGSDTITVGSGESIILGGAMGDNISGGSDRDFILGDNGHVYRDSARVVQRVETTDPEIGGVDTIFGNGGNDIILGGAMGDEIHGGAGNDIIFGDNGFINYAGGVAQLVQVSDPTIGGNDWIEGNGGSDIVIGGTGADLLSGDTGSGENSGASDARDIMFGDHAQIRLDLPPGSNAFAIFTASSDGGGSDIMYGNGGDDLMMGQQGDDLMFGGDGDDDMIGGHNAPFGSDGNDTMSGGAGADVMLGDNGNITRSVNPLNGDWVRNPAPFSDPVRQVTLYDILDGVGGNDIMSGNAGDDIMYGQRGNDLMSGGAGDDEMYGGLGDDTMTGDTGNDVMLGGLGQIIRAFNANGTAKLNPNGSWHKDVLLTDVAYVVGTIPLDGPNVPCGDLATVNGLLNADVTLLTGAYNADGSKSMINHCTWDTQAILLDLVRDGNDTISGGDGDDAIFGQRGNDTLSGDAGVDLVAGGTGNDTIAGGDGNDTLVGDDAFIDTNPAMPNVTHGFQVVHTDASVEGNLGIDLGMLGTTIVPMVAVAPGREVNAAALILPQVFGNESAIPSDNSLHTSEGGRIVSYASVITDFGHHLDLLHGNDTISGGNGNDTLVGDDLMVVAPTLRFDTASMARAEAITRSLLDISDNYSDLVHHQYRLLYTPDEHGHESDCDPVMIDSVFSIGEDTLDGGAGNDILIGDDSKLIAPSFILPVNLAEKFELFLNGVADAGDEIAHSVLDLIYLEHRMRDTTIQVQHGKCLDTVVVHHVDLVMMGNDAIYGGDGNDFIVGDTFDARAPSVMLTVAEAGTRCDDEHHENDWRDDEHWNEHGERASWWKEWGYGDHHHYQLDAVEADSDTIYGGAGNDLIWGDSIAMLCTTVIRGAGVSSHDFATAAHEVDEGLDSYVTVSNESDFWLEFEGRDHDHSHDNFGWAHDSDRDRERSHHHDNDGGDIIFANEGNDIVFGQDGRDVLHGDAGNDWLIGGADKDCLDGGTGQDKLYQGENESRQLREMVSSAMPTIDWSGQSGSFFGAPATGCASPWLDDFLNHLGQCETERDPNSVLRVRVG